ncbi:MAG: hypothetical protein ACREJ0_06530 [Geminicoccaceae bacterium]
MIAFIDLFSHLDTPSLGAAGLEDVLSRYPRQAFRSPGKHANTLIVALPEGGTVSLRPFYDEVERFFRAEHKRFDYPSCAPHATQAWQDYGTWLDALATFPADEPAQLRQRVVSFVLDTLPSQAFDPASVTVEPPLFQLLLEGFETTARKGEPTGAAFQGIVFGFLRADNPHLQIEIDKVRTGSKRLQRVADIDGWEGARLAISAEVKQYALKAADISRLESFANETGRRAAIGLVVALEFEEGARAAIEALGLKPVDVDQMLDIVELWDPLKQRTATNSLVYYARHVEKNASLASRIEAFLERAAATSIL